MSFDYVEIAYTFQIFIRSWVKTLIFALFSII